MSGGSAPRPVSGVAMSFPNDNQRCVEKRRAEAVDAKQGSLNSVLLAPAARHSQNTPIESRKGRPAFIEDFVLEHSRFDQQRDSIKFVGCF
jgi:hypothetical protein